MPLIKILKPLKFAHEGVRVEEFEPGDEPIEATDEMANHDGLVEEGYIELVGEGEKAPKSKAKAKA